MKWFALLLGLLLAVAIYTIAEQDAEYVALRNYAVKITVKNKIQGSALNKCVMNSFRST